MVQDASVDRAPRHHPFMRLTCHFRNELEVAIIVQHGKSSPFGSSGDQEIWELPAPQTRRSQRPLHTPSTNDVTWIDVHSSRYGSHATECPTRAHCEPTHQSPNPRWCTWRDSKSSSIDGFWIAPRHVWPHGPKRWCPRGTSAPQVLPVRQRHIRPDIQCGLDVFTAHSSPACEIQRRIDGVFDGCRTQMLLRGGQRPFIDIHQMLHETSISYSATIYIPAHVRGRACCVVTFPIAVPGDRGTGWRAVANSRSALATATARRARPETQRA